MNQIVTKGIVLRRVSYQEADRILTVLTPDYGKVTLIAKGARRSKSKLAGGIELFSVSDITYIKGRKDIGTLISSRLAQHFPVITADLDRTMIGYDMIKRINKIVEEGSEEDHFQILQFGLVGLNDPDLYQSIAELWFALHLLQLTGHQPDFQQDINDEELDEALIYNFDFDRMRFVAHSSGSYSADHIKLLRFMSHLNSPQKLSKLAVKESISDHCNKLVKQMVEHNLQV